MSFLALYFYRLTVLSARACLMTSRMESTIISGCSPAIKCPLLVSILPCEPHPNGPHRNKMPTVTPSAAPPIAAPIRMLGCCA